MVPLPAHGLVAFLTRSQIRSVCPRNGVTIDSSRDCFTQCHLGQCVHGCRLRARKAERGFTMPHRDETPRTHLYALLTPLLAFKGVRTADGKCLHDRSLRITLHVVRHTPCS